MKTNAKAHTKARHHKKLDRINTLPTLPTHHEMGAIHAATARIERLERTMGITKILLMVIEIIMVVAALVIAIRLEKATRTSSSQSQQPSTTDTIAPSGVQNGDATVVQVDTKGVTSGIILMSIGVPGLVVVLSLLLQKKRLFTKSKLIGCALSFACLVIAGACNYKGVGGETGSKILVTLAILCFALMLLETYLHHKMSTGIDALVQKTEEASTKLINHTVQETSRAVKEQAFGALPNVVTNVTDMISDTVESVRNFDPMGVFRENRVERPSQRGQPGYVEPVDSYDHNLKPGQEGYNATKAVD